MLAVAACCVAGLAGTTASASAVVDLSCSASATIDFSPALNGPLANPATVSAPATGALSGCSSLNGSQPGITSGALAAPAFTASGCFPAPLVLSGPATVTWNDASTSTLDVHLSTNLFAPPILNIAVTAGRMAGDSALPVPVFVPNGLGCGLGGTNSLNAFAVVAFLP